MNAPPTRGGLNSLMGIQARLVLLLFIMFASTLLIQAYVFHKRYQAHRSEQLQANLEIARAAAGTFEGFVENVLRVELAIGIGFTLPQPPAVDQMNAILAVNCREYPAVRNLAWATPEGRTIASNLPGAIGLDVTTRPFYREIVGGKDHAISDLYRSQVDGAPCFSISRGIRDATGSLLGIIIATVVPDKLDQVMAVERAKGCSMALVDGKGMLAYRHPAIDVPWEERNWIDRYPQFEEVLKGSEVAATVHATHEGKRHLAAFAPVAFIGWAATAGRAEDEAMAAINASLLPQGVLFLLATTAVFVLTLVWSRKISMPVAQLRDRALALGRGEAVSPAGLPGPTELNDLAEAFNTMADELRCREARLREQREWLRVILGSVGDAVIATDTAGRIAFMNPMAAELTGWTQDEAEDEKIGEVFRIMHEETRKPVGDLVGRILSEGRAALPAGHTVLISREGREIPIEDNASPIRDEAGNILGVVFVFHDVTEKRKARQAISELNRRLTVIVDSIADGFFALDTGFRFTHTNEASLRFFTKARQEMTGESIYDAFPGFKGSVFEAACKRAMDCGEPEHLEAPSVVTEGTVEIHAYPGPDNLTVLFRDVTDRKRMGEQLRKAHDELEMRVEERTAELVKLNEALKAEVFERRRSEDALQKERQRFRDVLDMLPAYVLLLDGDYQVPFLNRFFRERFGECGGRRCYEWLFNCAEPCENCETFTVLKTNTHHHWEWIGPDGRTYDIFDFPFTDSDGSPLIMEVGIDITELRRAEQSLKEANESLERRVAERTDELATARDEALSEKNRLEAIMEALPVGLAIFDERGGEIRSNAIFKKLWGSPRPSAEEARDHDDHEAWWVDTGQPVRPEEWASARAVRNGETVVGQLMEIDCFDGGRKFIMNSAAPVHDAQGKIVGCAMAVQDITDMKRAEREAQDRAAELEAVFLAQRDAVLTYDTSMKVKRANPAFSSTYGFDPVGLTLKEIVRRVSCRRLDGRPFLLEELPTPRALRGERVSGACFAVTRADGTDAVVQTSSGPMHLGEQITGSVTVWHDITELKRVETELRGSQERLNLHRERMPIGYIVYDDEFRFVQLNPAAERIFGYSSGELIGRHAKVIVPPDAQPHVDGILRRLAEGEMTAHSVNENLTKDNRTILCDWLNTPLKDADGKFTGFLSMVQDVTERRRVEEALRESEARFRLLSQTAAWLLEAEDPLKVVSDLAGAVMAHLDCQVFFNFMVHEESGRLRLNAFAGIPGEEARMIEWLDYGVAVSGCVARDGVRVVAEDICSVGDPRTELLKSCGIQAYVCHPMMAGARVMGTVSFGTRTRPRFSPQDLDLMKTVTDQLAVAVERMRLIAELEDSRGKLEVRVRKRTAELEGIAEALKVSEERLRKSNVLLQKVFDGISDPLIMLDDKGLVSMSNSAAADYYGVREGMDVLGKPCWQGLRGRETACVDCGYPFPSSGPETVSFERKGLRNPERVENVTVYPVFDEHGRRDAVIIKIADITKAKILERQILQNEKLVSLGLVTSGIAHEINNPNSFIYFNLPILRRYLEELMPIVDEHAALHPEFEVLHMPYGELREDIFKLLGNMEHGTRRISKTIEVLKGFVRKRGPEGMQQVDLKQVLDKVVALCRTELRHKVDSFEFLVPEGLPPLFCDPEALEQVFMNLLINAIHACDKPGSRVSLKVECDLPEGNRFLVEISDNGSGIEETVLERIFDPFFTTKPSTMGTGLGLYICHNHVESLGGRIEVESSPGRGSTFRVLLPRAGGRSIYTC